MKTRKISPLSPPGTKLASESVSRLDAPPFSGTVVAGPIVPGLARGGFDLLALRPRLSRVFLQARWPDTLILSGACIPIPGITCRAVAGKSPLTLSDHLCYTEKNYESAPESTRPSRLCLCAGHHLFGCPSPPCRPLLCRPLLRRILCEPLLDLRVVHKVLGEILPLLLRYPRKFLVHQRNALLSRRHTLADPGAHLQFSIGPPFGVKNDPPLRHEPSIVIYVGF